MTDAERDLALRYKARLQRSLGARLLQFTVFGSRARGDSREHSDLDIAVLVDRAELETKRTIAHLAADQMLEESEPLLLSPFVLDPARLDGLRRANACWPATWSGMVSRCDGGDLGPSRSAARARRRGRLPTTGCDALSSFLTAG